MIIATIIAAIIGGGATIFAAIITVKKSKSLKKVKIVQYSPGNNNTNTTIETQHNGLTVQDACVIAKTLFDENFPILKEEARKVVEQRFSEHWDMMVSKIHSNNIQDFSVFSDPDMQYVLYETQKGYARLGNKNSLEILSELLAKRICHNADDYLKIVIDKALMIVNQLSAEQLDYLSAVFVCKQVLLFNINSEQDLAKQLNGFEQVLHFPDHMSLSLLITMGCLEIGIDSVDQRIAKIYKFDHNTVKNIIPKKFLNIHPDYQDSHVGLVLAMTNLKNKLGIQYDLPIWVHL